MGVSTRILTLLAWLENIFEYHSEGALPKRLCDPRNGQWVGLALAVGFFVQAAMVA
jgi:hypothetical protein